MRRIAGIYNYCNRWCERCPLGHRCAVNSRHDGDEEWLDNLSKKLEDAPGAEDDSEIFPDENPEESFFDKENWAQMMEGEPRLPGPDLNLHRHPLALECQQLSAPWTRLLDALEQAWQNRIEAGVWHPTQLSEPAAIAVDNAQEVLLWYQHFFFAKVSRALMGQQETTASVNDWQSDWNGTAKVLLLGVKHCKNAAQALLTHLPELEDQALLLLAALQTWDKNLQKQFPHAGEFIRPGFDTLGLEEDYGG